MTRRSQGKKRNLNLEMEKDKDRRCSPLRETSNNGDGEEHEEPDANVDLRLILSELRDFRRDNKSQLAGIREEIKNASTRLDEAEGRIESAEERIQNGEDVMAEMLKLQTQLEAKMTDLEGRTRRENIRIYGVPEGAEKDYPSMLAFVEKLLRDNLDIPPTTNLQIERSHRALGPLPPTGAPPRSILAKFLSFNTKDMILRTAWQKKGFTWQGKQINLDNDYAPRILQKRKDFTEARKMLKDKGIKFQTMFPARLKVNYENGTQIYETVEEATADMAKRGLPITVIKPPETLMEQLRRLTWQRQTRGPRRGGGATAPSAGGARPGLGYKEKLQSYRRGEEPVGRTGQNQSPC